MTAPDSPKPASAAFAERLRSVREMRRLSFRDVGKAARCSYQTVKQLEEGATEPVLSTVGLLAKALAVTPEWLAFGVGEGPVERPEDQAREAPRAGRPRGTGKTLTPATEAEPTKPSQEAV